MNDNVQMATKAEGRRGRGGEGERDEGKSGGGFGNAFVQHSGINRQCSNGNSAFSDTLHQGEGEGAS